MSFVKGITPGSKILQQGIFYTNTLYTLGTSTANCSDSLFVTPKSEKSTLVVISAADVNAYNAASYSTTGYTKLHYIDNTGSWQSVGDWSYNALTVLGAGATSVRLRSTSTLVNRLTQAMHNPSGQWAIRLRGYENVSQSSEVVKSSMLYLEIEG